MKITNLTCAMFGDSPVVRIATDEGISGYGQVEWSKSYLKPWVLEFREPLVGEDPTDVERVMRKIRRRGGFKPYGSAVSAIEMALWDVAGKAAGVPVYKLLGGKVRDKVRVYNGSVRDRLTDFTPEGFAKHTKALALTPERFGIVKQVMGFHSTMIEDNPDYYYGTLNNSPYPHRNRGLLTEKGLNHMIACVAAMKEAVGDSVGIALDCGPGWTVPDAIRFAKAVEPFNLMWLEDMITGDCDGRPLSRRGSRDLHADPHWRADLPAAELPRADRDARRLGDRAGPLRCWWHRRAQVDRRVR